jgi:hypothetical protein
VQEPINIRYGFTPPDETPEAILDQICDLVASGGGVGTSWIRENLEKAFLIGYALHDDRVVGTSTHKYPKERYLKKDRSRDRPRSFRLSGAGLYGGGSGNFETGHRVKGHSRPDRKIQRANIYVTIDMNNPWPLRMTHRVGMVLAARFINDRTGHELGSSPMRHRLSTRNGRVCNEIFQSFYRQTVSGDRKGLPTLFSKRANTDPPNLNMKGPCTNRQRKHRKPTNT